MKAPMPPCGRACPRRQPGCHNEETCPGWKKYREDLAAWNAFKEKRAREEKDWREARGSILWEENRIRGKRKH